MLKSPLVSLSLLAAVASATLVGLPSTAQAAKPAPKPVQVSKVTAVERATPTGTEVTVGYTIKNRTQSPKAARFVRFYVVKGDGSKALFGRSAVGTIGVGKSLTAKKTRKLPLGPRFAAGDYRVSVCWSRHPQAVCKVGATSKATITIAPSRLTADQDELAVPVPDMFLPETSSRRQIAALRVEEPSESARVVLTNTGQTHTGRLSLAIEAGESNLPPLLGRAAEPSTNFEVEATTCRISLAPGSSCTVDVTRTEGGNPFASDRLVVRGARGAVSGVDLVAPVRFTPSSQDFGDVEVSETAVRTFVLHNDSDVDVSVFTGGVSGSDFYFTFFDDESFTCDDYDVETGEPLPIPAGDSCTVSVAFQPQTVGDHAGFMALLTTGGPALATMTGTGTPGDAPIPVRPGARSFGVTS